MSWRRERDEAEARRARWTLSTACAVVKQRMVILCGFISAGAETIELTDDERDAIRYLIDEHDYMLAAGHKIQGAP